MNYHFFIKTIHMSCAALSISLFVLRGWWMLRDPARLQLHWVRTVPHVIDSLLLGSAILLAINLSQYPWTQPWLAAKLTALLLYIGLGTVAIKRGRSREIRATAWLAAIAVFAYIVSVAITRQPLPFA